MTHRFQPQAGPVVPGLVHRGAVPRAVSSLQPKMAVATPGPPRLVHPGAASARGPVQARMAAVPPGAPGLVARPSLAHAGLAAQARMQPGAAAAGRPGFAPLQLSSACNCNKSGNNHKSTCPRNPNNMKAKAKVVKQQHQGDGSWLNMKHYRPGWVRDQNITEEMVKAFVKTYSKGKIRGHHSGAPDDNSKEHQNTTDDLIAYKSWHTKKYGWN